MTIAAESLILSALMRKHPGASNHQLSQILTGWEIRPFHQDGELTGAAMLKGTEFHCITTPHFKLRRTQMRDFLRPLFERHGCLTTRVEHADAANQRFNAAFGFRRTWSDSTFHYYMMAQLPFGPKGTQCQ